MAAKAAAHVEGRLIVWTNFLGKEPIRSVARSLGYAEAGEFIWAKQGSQQEGNERLLRVYETPSSSPRSRCPASTGRRGPRVVRGGRIRRRGGGATLG